MFVLEKVFLGGIVLFFICTRSSYTDHTDLVRPVECFEATDECPNKYITFYLYRKDNEKKPTFAVITEDTIDTVEFSPSDTLKILIHGIKGEQNDKFNILIRDAYFSKADYNIITVVYTPLGPTLRCYQETLLNMKIIARCTVRLLQKILEKNSNIKYRHLIGFSLGAQIAGNIAIIWNDENKIDKLERITALDPASPHLENGRSLLNADSATVVDVIHSNSGVLGQILPIGTVDFYANGGIRQPGCEHDEHPVYCHHHRAYYYFAESITHEKTIHGFFATLSGSCSDKDFSLLGGDFQDVHVMVGEYLELETRGVYYFNTNSEPPFSPNATDTTSQVFETPQPNS
ncbi:Hypothetical protein CINCED_3A008732 [Cinara cedri]|uniref:Lipase/vitellogenin,Alpha/Beta hydrolase fold n=1 Tax=Cinara cedri TaxID=506608 RepID=A0A5E4N6E2_9HEMI|nr:Lipase/vitellogenin,Alpha/Beta hydrolase fold [Cinara cedri]VVC40275.1 Hypothetical protein CINCED_3A008732 [Cinara cedri]